jgi:hypothetical protein
MSTHIANIIQHIKKWVHLGVVPESHNIYPHSSRILIIDIPISTRVVEFVEFMQFIKSLDKYTAQWAPNYLSLLLYKTQYICVHPADDNFTKYHYDFTASNSQMCAVCSSIIDMCISELSYAKRIFNGRSIFI